MTLLQKAYDPNMDFVIALDGPSASGKGVIGNMLAEELKLKYFQSSLVYRGLAYLCLAHNINMEDKKQVSEIINKFDIFSEVQNIDLNKETISEAASKISVISEVRASLGKYLHEVTENNKRLIMEGRDIGTVIIPHADLKVFLTANVEVRAQRRYKQLLLEGKECMLSDVLNKLKERDIRDSTRSIAPLEVAENAHVIDATYLTPLQVIDTIKNIINKSN